jgi:hypothetical protein
VDLLFQALEALQNSGPATALRLSRYAYPLVNGTHIIGIALLVGAIVPLDLRLLGLWRSVPVAPLARVLIPMAMFGLLLAIAAGLMLFSVSATRYAGLGVFQAKLGFVIAGIANALLLHRAVGWTALEGPGGAVPGRAKLAALLSICLWLAAIVAGRLIAYEE